MTENFDLLGDPIPEGHGKRGRPPHLVTDKNRCKIMLLLAVGRTTSEIALAMGISEPTLRKNYFRELRTKEEARFRVEGTNLLRLYEQVEVGNVAAIKEMRKVMDHAEMLTGPYGKRDDKSAKPTKEPKIGKKEQQQQQASSPDTTTDMGDLMAKRQASLKLN